MSTFEQKVKFEITNTLTVDEVKAIYASEVAKYGAGVDAFKGTRTMLSAALQAKNDPPLRPHPDALAAAKTREELKALHDAEKAKVTTEQILEAERFRDEHPHIKNAHHYVQFRHGEAVWQEVDRLIAAAGIKAGG